jgi:hypothetical protein
VYSEGNEVSSVFLVFHHDTATSPTLISRPIGHAGAHGKAKFHAAEFGGDGEEERERERDGREGRVLSERRASFACGIKIRVPRYTVVLRSQTRPSGSFHVRTRREARLSASRNPFFSNLLPAERHARVYGADVAETATRASSNPS